jgi:hypothetical protein
MRDLREIVTVDDAAAGGSLVFMSLLLLFLDSLMMAALGFDVIVYRLNDTA